MRDGESYLDERAADIKFADSDSINYQIASSIEMKPVSWLWPGRIARGKISMISGHPGLGKSQLTASLAAVETTAGLWPVDRVRAGGGKVVFLSAEDDPADTIVPRLTAAGADTNKIIVLGSVSSKDKEGVSCLRSVNLTLDIPKLEKVLQDNHGVSLVIIDPISAYMGKTDSNNNTDVRGILAPIADFASRFNVAVVGISHLNKGGGNEAMLRFMGSIAFVAAARSAYAVLKDPNDPKRRLFLPVKNNIGDDTGGLSFHIEPMTLENGIETSRIMWGSDPVTDTADQIMSEAGDNAERTEQADAGEWLKGLLSDGPLTQKEVRAAAAANGFALRTVQRAMGRAGVESNRRGYGKDATYVWSMRANDDHARHQNNVAHMEKSGAHDDFPGIESRGNVAAFGRTVTAPKVNGRTLTAPFVDIGEVPEPPESGWETMPL